jgi:hypothetical protein
MVILCGAAQQYKSIGLITHGHCENLNSKMNNFLFYIFESLLSTCFHCICYWEVKIFTCFGDITCSCVLIPQIHTISLNRISLTAIPESRLFLSIIFRKPLFDGCLLFCLVYPAVNKMRAVMNIIYI